MPIYLRFFPSTRRIFITSSRSKPNIWNHSSHAVFQERAGGMILTGRPDMPQSRRISRPSWRQGLYPMGSMRRGKSQVRSEEHTSELQSRGDLVCRLLLDKQQI